MAFPKKTWGIITCLLLTAALSFLIFLLFPRDKEASWKEQIKTESLTAQYNGKQSKSVRLTSEFVTASMNFGLDMLNYEANVEKQKNVLVSPASALFALGMTGNGTDGETRKEFEQVLGDGLSMEELSKSYSTLLQQYKKVPSEKLVVANSIWLKARGTSVLPSFLETNARYFGQDIYSAPSLNDAKDDINFWVSRRTNGLIPRLYNPEHIIDDSTFMILINTIYFHLEWEQKFDKASTTKASFFPAPGQEISALMMNCCETVKYLEHDGAIGILKPYKDENFIFLAVLPPQEQTPEEYLKSLSGQEFLEKLRRASPKEISLTMPKFTLEFEANLNKFLRDAGMETAFSGGDFTQMCPGGLAQIDNVIQKTYIELDEEGTEAAAVTAVEVGSSISSIPQITLDRPFLYGILDDKNYFPLFLGILNQP